MSDSQRYLKATAATNDSNHTAVTRLAGFSVREHASTAAPAEVRLRHGSASGAVLVEIGLLADDGKVVFLPAELPTPSGVYVQVVAGTVSAVLYSWE